MSKNIVFLIGAGCTKSDAENKPHIRKPPLDSGFFKQSFSTDKHHTTLIRNFIGSNYGIDVLDPSHDSLEKILATLYSDFFTPGMKSDVEKHFRNLVKLFMKRIVDTTYDMDPNNHSNLYRILSSLISMRFKPECISFITFNQDIQIEKTLYRLSQRNKHSFIKDELFSYPELYRLQDFKLTSPISGSVEQFPQNGNENCIPVFKLHGSLNWHSNHKTRNISLNTIISTKKNFHVTTGSKLSFDQTYQSKKKKLYAFPIIIPPVTHKSSIMNDNIVHLWGEAQSALSKSDIVIVYGYSCPETDFESANVLSRILQKINKKIDFYLIDPEPGILKRYADLGNLNKIYYYSSGKTFIENMDFDITP